MSAGSGPERRSGADRTIVDVDAWEVLDSRGRPTVACAVRLADGSLGVAAVPSGASTGRHEARELRDGGTRYGGLGVLRAVGHVRSELAAAVVGRMAEDQAGLDLLLREVDGTPWLGRLGANAVLSVSVAAALAHAHSRGLSLWRVLGDRPLLPLPMVNIVSGGAHAGGAVDIQDVLVVPVGAATFGQAIEWAARVRSATAEIAAARGLPAALVADEGGVAGPMASNLEALELVAAGIEAAGFQLGEDVGLALDIAATQLLDEGGRYALKSEGRVLESGELVDEVSRWCRNLPVVSVEDVLGEDDWQGWRYAATQLAGVQLVGDDLFATDPDRVERGVTEAVASAVLVKVNQNGTLSGGLDVAARARAAGFAAVVSARSGETEDGWLADVAVGSRAGQIKVGSTMRSERTAKWNRLLRIERELEREGIPPASVYAGASALVRIGTENNSSSHHCPH